MKKVIYLFALGLLFLSCKKNHDATLTKSRFELISDKKWQIAALSGVVNGITITDAYSGLPDYDKDDYYYFKDNLSYELNANLLKRSGYPEQIIDSGTWQLTTSDSFLVLNSRGSNMVTIDPINILELTEDKLVIQWTDSQYGDIRKYTFKAIP
jgi:hypothetical protein